MSELSAASPAPRQALLVRTVLLFGAWVALGQVGPMDLVMGAVAALACAFASLRYLPAGTFRFDAAGAFAFAGRFLRRSVEAGFDIARRVFDPALPIRPGVIAVPCETPLGPMRQALRASVSLQPGTVPLRDREGELELHALDTAMPVAADLAFDEKVFARAFGGAPPHE